MGTENKLHTPPGKDIVFKKKTWKQIPTLSKFALEKHSLMIFIAVYLMKI
jgi:hypothetical protein